jgi:hypothetical protein
MSKVSSRVAGGFNAAHSVITTTRHPLQVNSGRHIENIRENVRVSTAVDTHVYARQRQNPNEAKTH